MNIERLALHKLQELQQRLAAPGWDDYRAIMLATLLHHLLLEHLITDACRETGAQVRFTIARPPDVGPMPVVDGLVSASSWMELSPDAPDHWTREQVKPDRFVRFRPIQTADAEYSIADILNVAANRFGGKHHRANQRSPHLDQLAELDSSWTVNGLSMPLTMIPGIAEATRAACEPLLAQLSGRSL